MVQGNSRTIMVVDDDQDLLEMMEVILDGAGYKVVTATDGRIALHKIEDKMPQLILLDMKMPIMDGWEFTKKFRDEFNHAAPIVVVTAAQDAKARALEIGAEGYLAKPFEINDLLDCVSHYVP